MPRKTLFAQSLVVLLREAVDPSHVRALLAPLGHSREVPAQEHWSISGYSFHLEDSAAAEGVVVVDIVEQTWPDEMSDAEPRSDVNRAWSGGYFGPLVHPGCLGRALAEAMNNERLAPAIAEHVGFLRLRLTRPAFHRPERESAPGGPGPLKELVLLTRVAQVLLSSSSARCLFDPNGDRLTDREMVQSSLRQFDAGTAVPYDLWANVRLHQHSWDEKLGILDTVGFNQLGIPDSEAWFPKHVFPPETVMQFIMGMSEIQRQRQIIIRNEDEFAGPAGTHWVAWPQEAGLLPPPRPVIRWTPTSAGGSN